MYDRVNRYIKKMSIISKFATTFPYLILISIFIGLLFSFIIGRIDFAIRGLVIAIPGVIASLILIKNQKENIEINNLVTSIKISQKNYLCLYASIYLLSLNCLWIFSNRSFYYMILILMLYIIILFQILSQKNNTQIILMQLFFVMINVIYSVTLIYPLYFGGTDILPHLFLSQVTYLSGHVIPEDLTIGYATFPLFHILISQATYIFNTHLNTAYFIISAPIFGISIFFIYYIFVNKTQNIKLSLMTVFIYSNLSIVVYYSMYMITRSIAFIGFLMILYIIYNYNKSNTFSYRILGIIITIFILLIHQVSTPQIISIILLIAIAERISSGMTDFKINKCISNNYILLFVVMFVAYWFYIAYSFTDMLISTRIDSLTATESLSIKQSVQAGNEWIFLLQNIDTAIITFFVLIGIGVIFWAYKNTYYSVFGLVSLFSLPLFLPNPLQTLWQTMSLFRFDRFMLLVSPFIAFSVAAGVFYFYNLLTYKNTNKLLTFIIITSLMIGIILPSLINTNPESTIIDSNRRYFTNSELSSFNFVSNHIPNDSTLVSDYFSLRYFSYSQFSDSDSLRLPYYQRRYIRDIDNIDLNGGCFILRTEPLNHNLILARPNYVVRLSKSDLLEMEAYNYGFNSNNKIYSNYNCYIYSDKD